jgi:transglutaminase-like putative cysteine protease
MNEYLKNTCPYDLSIPLQNRDMDAVEYFLFEQRRGYCEQFSSSLAVMARSLDTRQGGHGLRPRRV